MKEMTHVCMHVCISWWLPSYPQLYNWEIHWIQQTYESLKYSRSSQHLVLTVFLILAILVEVCRYLMVIAICGLAITNEVQHLFICLLATWISSFVKDLFKFYSNFLFSLGLSVPFLLICRSIFYILANSLLLNMGTILNYPSPCCLHFYPLNSKFW